MLLSTLFEPAQAIRLTPLLNAIERGDVWGVANQVAGGHSLDVLPGLGTSALIVATSSKQQDVVEWLIEAGADVGLRDVLGRNALMYACQAWERRTAIFDTLVAHTPDLDEKDPEGYTALIHAARSDRPDLVRALLAAGAGLHIRDRYGYTALGHAMRLGHVATFEVLAQAGGDLMAHDDKGIAYWKTAVHEVHEDLLLAWIQQGGVANVADPMGWSLLMLACEAGMERLVLALLAAGADPTIATQNGDEPRDVATTETAQVLDRWRQAQDWRVRLGDLAAVGRTDDSEDGREKRRM